MNTLNDALDSTGPWGDDAMGKAQEVFYMCKVRFKIIENQRKSPVRFDTFIYALFRILIRLTALRVTIILFRV